MWNKLKSNSNSKENEDESKYQYPNAEQYGNICFEEILERITYDFPKAIFKRDIKIFMPEAPEYILKYYFTNENPTKMQLTKFHNKFGQTQFDNIEIDCLVLINEEPGITKFELSSEDHPVKFKITPPCIIVCEFIFKPAHTFQKLQALEENCCAVQTLPYRFFTIKELKGQSIEHFKIYPLLITNHSFSHSLDQFQLSLFKLNEWMQKKKKTGGFVLAKHPAEIKIKRNKYYKELIFDKELQKYINWQQKFLCMHLFKKYRKRETFGFYINKRKFQDSSQEEFSDFEKSLRNKENMSKKSQKVKEQFEKKMSKSFEQYEKKNMSEESYKGQKQFEMSEKFEQKWEQMKEEIFKMIQEYLKQK